MLGFVVLLFLHIMNGSASPSMPSAVSWKNRNKLNSPGWYGDQFSPMGLAHKGISWYPYMQAPRKEKVRRNLVKCRHVQLKWLKLPEPWQSFRGITLSGNGDMSLFWSAIEHCSTTSHYKQGLNIQLSPLRTTVNCHTLNPIAAP